MTAPAPRRFRPPKSFDRNLIVIGGGSAGLVAAYIAAAVRARVTLIERDRMGGDCLNTGCVPSKALIRSARFASLVGRHREFGMASASVEPDFAAVMQRVRDVVARVAPHDSVERYTALGVECVMGEGRLIDPWTVEVTTERTAQRLTARAIVIATGAEPLLPPIEGLATIEFLTSDNVWELRELPRRLVVLGGGPIGCELAQSFARLGSTVTLVEMTAKIMGKEDPDVADLVQARFEREGLRVLTGHEAVAVRRGDRGHVLVCAHGEERVEIPFDRVLVAVGRKARLDGYGLEELGVRTGRTIDTDVFLRTSQPSIFACGDVAGPYQFTHTAAHQAWYAAVNALFGDFKKVKADYSVIPWATFTEPEVATVGLNETLARERCVAYELTRFGIDELDRAIADGEAYGFVKVLTRPGRDRILGVTIAGEHAGELIAEFVLAMKHGIGLNKLLGTIHVYPTLAEANKYAAGAWKRAHAPQWALRLLARFHAWRL